MRNMLRALSKEMAAFSPFSIVLGLSCWIAWIFCVYSGDPFKVFNDSFFEFTSSAFLYSTFALSISLILISQFPEVGNKVTKSIPAMVILGVLAGVFTFLEVIPGVINIFLFPIFAGGTGVCTSAIALRCASQVSELRTKDALIMLAVAQIVGVLIYAFIFMITKSGLELVALGIICVLPLLAVVFSLLEPPAHEDEACKPFLALPKPFWRLLCAVFILSVVFSLIRGYFPSALDPQEFDQSRTITAISLVLIMLTIISIVAYLPAKSNFGNFSYSILITASFLVVFVPLFGIDSILIGAIAVALLAISFYAVWGILACVAHKSRASVVRVFGFGFGIAALGSAIGVFIGNALHLAPSIDQSSVTIVGVVLVIISVIAALFFLNKESINQLMLPISMDESMDESMDDSMDTLVNDSKENRFERGNLENDGEGLVTGFKPRFKLRCQRIATRYGLSPRETEVMLLLAKGKDAKSISEILFISFNTTRTHIKNVYSKLEVHTRSEFLSLIDNEELEN